MPRQRTVSVTAHRQAQLAERARCMRAHMTLSETILWKAIRGGKLGVAFRRQVVIGDFIADFAAPSIKLVVEVDGKYHVARGAADARRDRKLARLRWRVVRVEADGVVSNLTEAVEAIRAAIRSAHS